MERKDCPPGLRYDILIKQCRPIRTLKRPGPANGPGTTIRPGTTSRPGPISRQGPVSRPGPTSRPGPAAPPAEPSRPPVLHVRATSMSMSLGRPGVELMPDLEPVPGLEPGLVPALWMLVPVVLLGSLLLAVILWIFIYRQQNQLHCSTGGRCQEPLQKQETSVVTPPLPAHVLQGTAGTLPGSERAAGFADHRDPAVHVGMEEGGGLLACCSAREHRVPLPATELGGTVLVTTKTV